MGDHLPPGFSKPTFSNWCHSVDEIIKVDFEWTIQNFDFRLYTKTLSKITSAEFFAEEFPTLKWSLQFNHVSHSNCTPKQIVDLTLYYSDEAAIPQSMPSRIKYGVFNRERCIKVENEKYLVDFIGETKNNIFLRNWLVSELQCKNNWISAEGHLTVFCEIEILTDKKITLSGKTMNSQSFSSNDAMIHLLEELYETKKLSDVTINVRGTVFKAHRLILTVGSPVFAAMLEQRMKENLLNQVDITDVEPDVFEEILRFIYTSRVTSSKMEELALGLLVAADKYLLEKLKAECEKYLNCRLSAENCIEYLMLADRHSAPSLEQNALNFFHRYPALVLSSDSWTEAAQNHQLLVWLKEKKIAFK